MVIVPGRSRAEASSEDVVTTRKQRRPVRPRLEAEPRVEEREILRRESDDGGRDFFGGLFGGQRDWGVGRRRRSLDAKPHFDFAPASN
jgi:hypothetical protein